MLRRHRKATGSILYNPKLRSLVFQIVIILAIVGALLWAGANTVANLANNDKKSGFDFLYETSGFQILTTPGTYLMGYEVGISTYLDVFWIGVINTLIVAFAGIIAATIVGFTVGIFRLSQNIILRSFAVCYIEILRNIPILLQLFFWYFFVLRLLPDKRLDPLDLPFNMVLDKTGLWSPFPVPQDLFWLTGLTVLIGIIATVCLVCFARRRQKLTGQKLSVFWGALCLILGLPALMFLITGSPLDFEMPVRGRFGFRDGIGMVAKPEMLAVWLALTLYTASYIAETVRAGIMSVSKGQVEAAQALGLKSAQSLRFVIIPQAMRVIIPPLTSQYLNLTKNSSLAVAIAYPDIVSLFAGTALSQVGQELEMIFMTMAIYLCFSLVTSLLMNWFNAKMRLVER